MGSTTALTTRGSWQMTPATLDEAMKYAKLISDSDMVPKDFRGKPGNVLVAIQMGEEVGLKPLQALQSIAVINGRPSIWGDAVPGLCQTSPAYEWHKEFYDEAKDAAVCIVKRKGAPEHRYEFSMKDVVAGGYDKKQGPWQTERRRMMQMRARRAFRDQFPDALKGLSIAEDMMDIAPDHVESQVVDTKKPQIESLKERLLGSAPIEGEVVTDTPVYDMAEEGKTFNANCAALGLSTEEIAKFKAHLGFSRKTTAEEVHAVNADFNARFDEFVGAQQAGEGM